MSALPTRSTLAEKPSKSQDDSIIKLFIYLSRVIPHVFWILCSPNVDTSYSFNSLSVCIMKDIKTPLTALQYLFSLPRRWVEFPQDYSQINRMQMYACLVNLFLVVLLLTTRTITETPRCTPTHQPFTDLGRRCPSPWSGTPPRRCTTSAGHVRAAAEGCAGIRPPRGRRSNRHGPTTLSSCSYRWRGSHSCLCERRSHRNSFPTGVTTSVYARQEAGVKLTTSLTQLQKSVTPICNAIH